MVGLLLGTVIRMNLFHSRGRRYAFLTVAILAIALVFAWQAGRQDIEELVVQPASNETVLPTAQAVSPEERAFYDFVGPRLRSMTAEARELNRMGQERSRDLIGLQVRSDRVFKLAAEVDEYVAARPVPPRFAGAVAQFQAAVAAMRTGSDQARSAFLRFDWNAIAAGLATFGTGADELDAAYAQLRATVGAPATPSPVASNLRLAA